MKKFIKKPLGMSLAILAVMLVGAGLRLIVSPSSPEAELIEAQRGTISQSVSVTGKVKPVNAVDLAFESSGRITNVYAKAGDKVMAGDMLVQLNQTELIANLNQARAGLGAENAKLNELVRGTRAEDILITEAGLKKVRQDLSSAYANVPDVLRDAYTKSEDAIRIKTVSMFSGTEHSSFSLIFETCGIQNRIDTEALRLKADLELDTWKRELSALPTNIDTNKLDEALKKAAEHSMVFRNFADALNSALYTCPQSQNSGTISTYGTNAVLARSNIITALSETSDKEQSITTYKVLTEQAQKTLDLKKAGSDPEQINAQRAAVKQAEAKAQQAEAQLAKTVLHAPFAGMVTKEEAKVGEIASPNVILVSLMSESTLEIEASIPEVDIGKIKVGNTVTIQLDALPDKNFKGRVSFIDPAETIVDGVVNFKIKINFGDNTEGVKSGLTTNLVIRTLEKDNVVVLPQFAIIENDKGTFVRIPESRGVKDVPIQIGIRGENGDAEIISGVREGTKVLNVAKTTN